MQDEEETVAEDLRAILKVSIRPSYLIFSI